MLILILPHADEQLLFAAKTNADNLITDIFESHPEEEYNVNHQDGLGNTRELFSMSRGSEEVENEERGGDRWEGGSVLEHGGVDGVLLLGEKANQGRSERWE